MGVNNTPGTVYPPGASEFFLCLLSRVHVAQSFVLLTIGFHFVPFLLAIVISSLLQYTPFDNPFVI
jgi:hypothetical protein